MAGRNSRYQYVFYSRFYGQSNGEKEKKIGFAMKAVKTVLAKVHCVISNSIS